MNRKCCLYWGSMGLPQYLNQWVLAPFSSRFPILFSCQVLDHRTHKICFRPYIFKENNTQFQQVINCHIWCEYVSLFHRGNYFWQFQIILCETQWTNIDEACFPHKGTSAKRFLSQLPSSPINSGKMNSNSIVGRAI